MQKNRVVLAGYLGAKPNIRYLPSGTPVANASLAESYWYEDGNKGTVKHTNWHPLVFYGPLALIAQTYEKGDNIYIEGSYQTRLISEASPRRKVYEVVVRSAHLIAKPRTDGPEPEDDNELLQSDETPDQLHQQEEVSSANSFWQGTA